MHDITCAGATSPTISPPETKATSPVAPSPISHVTVTAALGAAQAVTEEADLAGAGKASKKAPPKAAKSGQAPGGATAAKGGGRLGGAAEASQARRVKAIQAAAKLQVCPACLSVGVYCASASTRAARGVSAIASSRPVVYEARGCLCMPLWPLQVFVAPRSPSAAGCVRHGGACAAELLFRAAVQRSPQ